MAKAIKTAAKVFVVTFLVATGASFIFAGVGGTVAGSVLFGVETLAMAALSGISQLIGGLMSKGISATAENFGTKVATRTATAPRQIIYGKARVGGTITHIETSGTDNYKLSMIVVLAGHEVESLEEVLINDTKLTTTSSGGFEYATNSRFTNSENENKFGVSNSLLRYKFKDGSQTTADSTITGATSLGSTDKFIGMAYMLIEMVFDSEAFGGGIPPLAFVIKGKKVYDPRTSTTVWSDNPALCVRDYITDTTYGLKATSDEVLDTTALGGFASAANTCENQAGAITTATVNGAVTSSTTVTIDSASTNTLIDIGQTVTGTGISNSPTVIARRGNIITLSSAQTISDGVTLTFNEDLYKANGITNMAADGTGVLEGLLSACAGKLSYINGKFVMFAGATVTPDMTITDDNLLAPISVATKNSGGETFNTVKAVYVDANNNYVATDSPVYTDSTLIANDTPSGESQANYRKTLELQLPFTDTTTMAQRLQRTALLHSRQEVSLSVLCNIAFMQLQPFDWVYLTNERLGYTNKTFEVLATNLEVIESDDVPILATRLALKEIDSSVYSFASSSYTNPIDEGSSVSTGSFTVTAPTNLSVSATLVNTGYDLQVQWTNNTDDLIQGTEILYGTSSGTYISSAIAGKGKTKEIIPNVKPNSTYYIVARHFSANNVFSAVTSEVTISTSSGTGINTPSAPTSLSATTGKPLNIGLSWTNPSNSDLRDIKIYRSTSSGFTPNDGTNLVRTIAGVPSVSQKVSFGIDDGLVAGTTYYFKVKAVSFFDKESSASSQASGSFTKVEATDIDAIFSGYFHVEGSTTTAFTDSAFNTAHGRLPIEDDILIMVNTSPTPKVSKAYKYSGTSGSGGSFVEITNFQTGDLIVDGTIAGSKIIADTVNGNVFQATTTITAGTGNNVGVLDGADSTFRIYAGNATPTSAPFRVSQTGALTATSGEVGGFTLGATSLTNTAADSKIQIGSGSEIFTVDGDGIYLGNGTFANAPFKVLSSGEVQTTKSFTAGVAGTDAIAKMSGTGDYRFWSGNEAPSNASFSVDKDGKAIAKNLVLKLTDGTVYFDSETGFSSSALSQISLTTGTKVTTLSSTFDADTEYEEITVTQNTTVNVSVSIDSNFGGSGGDFNANTAIDEAEQDVPENFTLTIEHSSDGGSSYSTVVTDTFSRVNDRLNPKTTPASDEYKINTTTEELFISGQGGVVYLTTTTTSLNLGCVDADGRTTLSYTGLSLSGISTGTTHRIRASVSTTDTNYDTTNNNVSSTAPRVVSVTDPSGDGFYVGDSSGSQVTPEGDITRVQITTASSSGLTGGANFTSGDALFTLALASSIDGAKTFTNNVVIQGDLDVQGTTTTIDTTNLDVKDKNITLNYGTGDTSANANGAGITIQDAVSAGNDATLTWNTSNDTFNFSHDITTTGIQMGTGASNDIQADGKTAYIGSAIFGNSASTNVPATAVHIKSSGTPALRIEDLDSTNQVYDFISNYGVGLSIVDQTSSITPLAFAHTTGNATFAGTISSGAITSSGALTVGSGTQSVASDADITVREGNAFAGIDLKSTRTSGNIGGLRSYNSSNTIVNQLLLRVDGSINILNSNGLQINNTTVIDGSRNITAGTISSGAITSSASITASGNSNNFGNTTIAALSATSGTFSASITASGNSNSFGNSSFGTISSGAIAITTAAVPLSFVESGHTGNGQYWRMPLDGGNLRFDVSLTGGASFTTYDNILQLNSDGSINVQGAQMFDSSGNISTTKTISSGAITSTGAITLNGSLGTWSVDNQGAIMNFTRATANYIKAGSTGGYLVFQTNGANAALTLNSSQNATFAGTISSGNITSSGTITAGANSGVIKEIGSDLSLVQGAVGLRINDAASAISPTTASLNNDAAVDLGVSNIRFRNLYLSGTGTFDTQVLLPPQGTATSSSNQFESAILAIQGSGWDTNNALARTGTWTIKNVPTASVYPDFDLNFYETGNELRFQLHGRGTTGYVDPSAATFHGNVNINADSSGSTGAGGGSLAVAGALTLSVDGTDALNFSANSANDNRGISFNGRTALSADYNDAWLRINNQGEFGNGVYTPSNFRADGNVRGANFSVSTTVVIDSSRNLTNIGTISSGAITSSSTITTQADSASAGIKIKRTNTSTTGARGYIGFMDSDNNFVASIDSRGTGVNNSGDLRFTTSTGEAETGVYNLTPVLTLGTDQSATFAGTISSGAITLSNDSSDMGFGTAKAGSSVSHTASVDEGIFWHTTNQYGIYRTSGGWSSPNYQQLKIKWDTGIEIDGAGTTYGKSGINFLNGNIKMDGTQILDASRNLSNIGTINSGAITSTGLVTSVGGVVNTNTGSNAFYVTRSGATNQALKIYVDDAAAVFESIQDESLDNYGTFIFAMDGGTTEPFFDVRKGTASSGSKFRVDGSGALQVGSSNTTFLDSSRNLTNIGTISSGDITIGNGTTYKQSTDMLYVGGNGLDGADAAIYLGNHGGNGGYGWRFYYQGTGTGNLNKLIIRSENVTNPVDALSFTQDGNATFAGTIDSGNIYADYSLLGRGFRAANRGELHLNATGGTDVAEIFFGHGDGYTDANIRWGISDRGSADDRLIIYRGPDHGGFSEVAWFDASARMVSSYNGYSVNGTTVIDSARNLTNIASITTSGSIDLTGLNDTTDGADIHLPRGSHITFYGNNANNHSIGSRSNTGAITDDLRISSYGAIYFDLDSNSNNSSAADFVIGRHGGGTGTISNLFSISGETGSVVSNSNITAYGSASDVRLKENIEVIQNPIDKVQRLRGVTFNYKKDGSKSTGLIAQELEEVLPEVVYETHDLHDEEDKFKAVRYGNIVGLLVEAIKDQQQQIDELKAKIENGSS